MLLPKPIAPKDRFDELRDQIIKSIRNLTSTKHQLETLVHTLHDNAQEWKNYTVSLEDYVEERAHLSCIVEKSQVKQIVYLHYTQLDKIDWEPAFYITLGIDPRGWDNEKDSYYFEVVDVKKWFLAKLKYGI